MSERERWIVYPLLFFALGAAVRDKILHRVDTKEIYCETLKIVDQQDPTGRAFAELSIERARPEDPSQVADRVGLLRLVDSDGQEIFRVENDAYFGRMIGRELRIVDELKRPLVIAGVEHGPGMMLPNGEQTITSEGVIYLNNQRLGIRLSPPAKRSPPPPAEPPAESL